MNQLVNRRHLLGAVATAAAISPLALFAEKEQQTPAEIKQAHQATPFPELIDGKPAPHVRAAIHALKLAKHEISISKEGTYGVYKKAALESIEAALQQLTFASEAALSKVEAEGAKQTK
jgi:hypothetical protein